MSLIRGLRNENDLHDESNLFNYSRDYTGVPFVYFLCKSENSHIGSGSIRKLKRLEKDVSRYLP
jgi:phosphopantetheine adenylyltransferase